ncbi:MAG: PilZ domain-containing protein [Dehalococcoidia bacterium]|nr:PilZ domain-containing protein [Dehalococcoidia bacterium]
MNAVVRRAGGAKRAIVGGHNTVSTRNRIDLAERRVHRRYPAWLDAALHDRGASVLVPVTVVDISVGGALLQSPHPLTDGADVALSLTTPGGTLELDGHAVRTEESWLGPQVHIGFELVDPATRLQLFRLLDELQSEFTRGQSDLAKRRIRQ